MGWGDFSEVDGMVIALLGMMALSFGIILLLVASMCRNVRRRNREVDDLLDAVREEERRQTTVPATGEEKERLEAWERERDWWK